MELNDQTLADLEREIAAAVDEAKSREGIERIKRDWLAKEGKLRQLFKFLKDVPADRKPEVASKLNGWREQLEGVVAREQEAAKQAERAQSLRSQFLDLSLPASNPGVGHEHPITIVERKITEILKPFGFRLVQGPEVETEYYCFDSLNIPRHHPARDMQDTFFTESLNGLVHVLRTHTTSVQARTLQKGGLPVKIASPGRAYRNETEDASHTAMFHQYELVWVDKGLTLSHLMALISHILKGLYGKRRKVRFVPKHYPYTEPSIGPQIDCSLCKGAGCPACGGAGWVTIAGAGMIHRNVLKEFNYDPDEVSGFAFGLGTSRLAGQLCDLPKLRMIYGNDLRIYKQL